MKTRLLLIFLTLRLHIIVSCLWWSPSLTIARKVFRNSKKRIPLREHAKDDQRLWFFQIHFTTVFMLQEYLKKTTLWIFLVLRFVMMLLKVTVTNILLNTLLCPVNITINRRSETRIPRYLLCWRTIYREDIKAVAAGAERESTHLQITVYPSQQESLQDDRQIGSSK